MKFGGGAETGSSNAPIKFVGSTSASTGQNAILGKGTGLPSNLVTGKFGKPKAEKSPSVERQQRTEQQKAEADTDAEKIELFGATPGMTQKTEAEPPDDLMTLEEQASEDAKRHKRALGEVEVEEDKKRREAEAAAAELWTWRKELDKEKDKRRDLEEQMDDLKLEVGFNREACAKATHAIGKLVASQLQEAEKSDQAISWW